MSKLASLRSMCGRMFEREDAQDVAEYAVLLAVVLIIVIATASALGTGAHSVFSHASSTLSNVAH